MEGGSVTDHDWSGAAEVFEEAARIIRTDRNKQNGDPEDNFADIALAWTGSLRARGLLEVNQWLTAADVARLMCLLKMIRDSNAPNRDNRVDNCGYTGCLERVEPTGGRAGVSEATCPHCRGTKVEPGCDSSSPIDCGQCKGRGFVIKTTGPKPSTKAPEDPR